jgi:hypothetical protein
MSTTGILARPRSGGRIRFNAPDMVIHRRARFHTASKAGPVSGGTIYYDTDAAVPEPSSLVLASIAASIGMLAAATRGRRKRGSEVAPGRCRARAWRSGSTMPGPSTQGEGTEGRPLARLNDARRVRGPRHPEGRGLVHSSAGAPGS